MRKGEITKTMIRQSKEIWELLKPDEFEPEPGDWISTLHIYKWLMYEPNYIDERGNLRDKWYSMIQFGNDDWHPIFTFSHCLDLLRGLGCEFHIAIVNKASKEVTLSFWYTSYTVGHGNNLHECAQSVLLKVLKGES